MLCPVCNISCKKRTKKEHSYGMDFIVTAYEAKCCHNYTYIDISSDNKKNIQMLESFKLGECQVDNIFAFNEAECTISYDNKSSTFKKKIEFDNSLTESKILAMLIL